MAAKGEDVTCVGKDEGEKQTPADEKTKDVTPNEDSELNDLLDSALEDFDKPDQKPPTTGTNVDQQAAAEGGANPQVDMGSLMGGQDDQITEELADEMAKQFEEAMKSFMSQDPEMMQQINKLAEAAGNAGDSAEAQQEFASTLTQTLSGLAENAETLQGQMSEEELSQAFGNMGVGGGVGGGGQGAGPGPGGDMFPMMHNMMKMLLSKDVLYPSLKEISDKYPKWLDENRDKEEQSAIENYEKQHALISSICVEFESETPTDTDEVKSKRFDKLMDLMQQMQELGQPPKEIVGEMAPGLEFDENGLPKLPGMNSQCVVM